MLVLDFDGVLIDSIDEVALTAYNAATGNLATSLSSLPNDPIRLFQCNRFHVQQIGDAIPLMQWCLQHQQRAADKILSLGEYEHVIAGCADDLNERTRRIYEARNRLIAKDQHMWLQLHSPCQPLWKELIRHDRRSFVILTNKNHDATLRLCRHFRLDVRADDVFSGDHGTTKIENMLQVYKRFGRQVYYVVDDSLKNLKQLDRNLNRNSRRLTPLLAAWGYTGPDDLNLARESGIQVVNQTDLIAILQEHRP